MKGIKSIFGWLSAMKSISSSVSPSVGNESCRVHIHSVAHIREHIRRHHIRGSMHYIRWFFSLKCEHFSLLSPGRSLSVIPIHLNLKVKNKYKMMFCLTQQTWGIHPMLFRCWANIETALGECLVFAVNMSVSSVNTIGLTQC